MNYQQARNNNDKTRTYKHREALARRFADIINEFSLENDSDTPDFIIGEYLVDCLITMNIFTKGRHIWKVGE